MKRVQSMENKGFTPKLRFPDFRETPEWEAKELRSIADPVSERADCEDNHNILTLSGEHGLVLQSEYFGKQIAGTKSERYVRIQRDDFVYNDRTTKASEFGTIKRLSKYGSGIVSPIYKCFRFKEGELPAFWEWYFESGAHDVQLRGLANEGARAGRFNVSIDRFLSTNVHVPDPESGEQRKIAECLSTLDELIGAEGQKLDALKAHKKGLMQQLFPREGETVPRLRFPEFRDAPEWEERPLGAIVEVASGQVDPKESPYCDFPQIGSENIESESGKVINVKSAREKGVISGNYFFDERDVLYSKIRPALNKVAAPTFRGVCSADIYPIRPTGGSLLRSYLVFLLLSERFLGYAIRSSDRGKIPKINREALLTYEAQIPSTAEQHRIATCLSSLKELIAAQSDKLSMLESHKQGIMQQLFPSLAGPTHES